MGWQSRVWWFIHLCPRNCRTSKLLLHRRSSKSFLQATRALPWRDCSESGKASEKLNNPRSDHVPVAWNECWRPKLGGIPDRVLLRLTNYVQKATMGFRICWFWCLDCILSQVSSVLHRHTFLPESSTPLHHNHTVSFENQIIQWDTYAKPVIPVRNLFGVIFLFCTSGAWILVMSPCPCLGILMTMASFDPIEMY